MHRRSIVRIISCLVLILSLAWLPLGSAAASEGARDDESRGSQPGFADTLPAGAFTERIDVQLFSVEVRAVDHKGRPLPDLGVDDFRVEVGGQEASVVGVDWVTAGPRQRVDTDVGAGRADSTPVPEPAARLLVIFVQNSSLPHRALGLRRMLFHLDSMLEALHPSDWVAVVTFHHHLEMVSDFTRDHSHVRKVVEETVHFEDPAPHVSPDLPADRPTLVGRLDPDEAADAAFVETGLEILAEALRDLPGEKLTLFLGWGLGVEHGGRFTPRLRSAVEALHRADVTVSSVAVGNLIPGVGSNLDGSVRMIAAATGGMYAKLQPYAERAMSFVARSLDGHYVVTFDPSTIENLDKALGEAVEITLREGPYRVRHRPLVLQEKKPGG